jgi:hypothetical protein
VESVHNPYGCKHELPPTGIWTHAPALAFKQRLGAVLESEGVCRGDTMGYSEKDAMAWPAVLRQVVTTRNLSGSMLLTHLCMGLNSHIELHLFGTLPASRISEARKTTRLLCQRYGVPYTEFSELEALGELQRYNRDIATIAQHARHLRQELVQDPRLMWSEKNEGNFVTVRWAVWLPR